MKKPMAQIAAVTKYRIVFPSAERDGHYDRSAFGDANREAMQLAVQRGRARVYAIRGVFAGDLLAEYVRGPEGGAVVVPSGTGGVK